MDEALHEIRARLGDLGVILIMEKQSLYSGDDVMLAKSAEELDRIMGSFDDVCMKKVLIGNPNKSRVSF